MVVSETKQEKLSVIYQAFCETWLSLLFPRQKKQKVLQCSNKVVCTRERMHRGHYTQKAT